METHDSPATPVMIDPDDPILSAYLDGELDARKARHVERAVAADPRLAESLNGLHCVRALVAGLSRPEAPDISAEVLARLARQTPSRTWGRSRSVWAGAVATTAAAILLVWVSWTRPPARVDPSRGRPAGETPTPSGPTAATIEGTRSEAVVHRARARGDTERATVATNRPPDSREVSSPALASTVAGVAESPDVLRVRQLLDDPRLHRVFLLTDRIDRPLEPEVAALVERTTRHDFFRITVAEGIVIDPKHPGGATVLAVVLDESELIPFRERLLTQFADRVEEAEIDPMIPLQLAEIGQVVSFPPDPAGDVTIPPPASLALREARPPSGPEESESAASSAPGPLSARFTERPRSRPARESTTSPAPGPEPREAARPDVADLARPADDGSDRKESATVASRSSPPRLPTGPGAAPHPGISADHSRTPSTAAAGKERERCVVLVWIAAPGKT